MPHSESFLGVASCHGFWWVSWCRLSEGREFLLGCDLLLHRGRFYRRTMSARFGANCAGACALVTDPQLPSTMTNAPVFIRQIEPRIGRFRYIHCRLSASVCQYQCQSKGCQAMANRRTFPSSIFSEAASTACALLTWTFFVTDEAAIPRFWWIEA